MKYKTLILSGGGCNGISHLGVIYYYESIGFTNFNTYIGTSIGSIICLLLNVGYTSIEIFKSIVQKDTLLNFKISLYDTIMKNGLYPIKDITYMVELLVYKKLQFIPTMYELYSLTNKRLFITTSNITKSRIEILSYINNPDLSVIDAINMSCNLPFIFQEIEYKGCKYIDGGLANNFPIDVIDDTMNNILAVSITCKNLNTNIFINYVYQILNFPLKQALYNTLIKNKYDIDNYITIYCNKPFISFNLTYEEKLNLFFTGLYRAIYKDNK